MLFLAQAATLLLLTGIASHVLTQFSAHDRLSSLMSSCHANYESAVIKLQSQAPSKIATSITAACPPVCKIADQFNAN